MLGMARINLRLATAAAFSLLVLISFQNCTNQIQHGGGNSQGLTANSSLGGNGYDGKLYHHFELNNPCSVITAPNSTIFVSSIGDAYLIRQNCQDIKAQPLNTNEYIFADEAHETLIFRGESYEKEPDATVNSGGADTSNSSEPNLPVIDVDTQPSYKPSLIRCSTTDTASNITHAVVIQNTAAGYMATVYRSDLPSSSSTLAVQVSFANDGSEFSVSQSAGGVGSLNIMYRKPGLRSELKYFLAFTPGSFFSNYQSYSSHEGVGCSW